MYNKSGTVSVEEADFNRLTANFSEIYQWAQQGKKIYKDWMKIYGKDNGVEDVVHIIRNAKTLLDCRNSIASKFGVSKMSAEKLAHLTLYQIVGMRYENMKESYELYSLATKQLKPLFEKLKTRYSDFGSDSDC